MKQYGDIAKLSGYDLDPVDLIVGGSPCQDLSVAGKRAGLDGERSGLFMEMIRIIKEMRSKTNGIYPRFALWENVPGAFSSNKGADFSAVLGEFARIAEPDAPDVPVPEEGWSKSGVLLGSDWSLAWRTHDAQFWGKTIRDSRTGDVLALGTPQRRRRIALVVDLRGQSAPEILFERKGLSGNPQQGSQTEQGSAETSADSVRKSGASVISFQERSGKPGGEKGILIQEDHVGALSTLNNQMVFDSQIHHGCKEFADGICQTISQEYGTGGNNQPLVVATTQDEPTVYGHSSFGNYAEGTGSLLASGGDIGGGSENLVIGAKCADDHKGANRQYVDDGKCQITNNLVRRLTPLECERLQGYPDGWTNIPGASDSAKYKALGNSICLPFWEHLAHRFAEMGDVKKIGSLFDGIGGFPLVFKRAGVETLWASEIEPFCQKVVEWHVANGDL